MKELLRHGFFISIGAAILTKKTENTLAKAENTEGGSFSKMLHQIPFDRLFFETDDAENVSIVDIYQAAAELLAIDLNDLKSIVYDNFKKL